MPTLWTPANLATPPVAWFDAQDASTFTLDNDSYITEWRSKAGANKGAGTGTSVSRQPTGFPGGYPAAMFFGGGTQPILLANTDGFPIGTADGTIIAVAAQTSSGFYPEVFHYGPTASGQQRQIFASGSTSFLVASNNGRDGNTGVDSAPGTIIVGAYIGGNLVRSYSNGDPTPYEVSGAFNTGSGSGAIGPGGWYGAIGEILVLGYIPSAGERQQIEGYCAWRWGRQAALPAAHPYKSAAPTTGAMGPASGTQVQASEVPSLAGRSSASPASASQPQVATAASLTRRYATVPAAASNGHAATAPALAGKGAVAPASAGQMQTAAAPALAGRSAVSPDQARQDQRSAEPGLTSAGSTAPADAAQPQLSSISALAGRGAVYPDATGQAQGAGTTVLIPGNSIAAASGTQSHAASLTALAARSSITVSPASHAHAASGSALTAGGSLAIESAAHAQVMTATSVTYRAFLSPASTGQQHAASAVTVQAGGSLAAAAGFHLHVAAPTALTVRPAVAPGAGQHAHASTGAALAIGVAVDAAVQAQITTPAALLARTWLTVVSGRHAQFATAPVVVGSSFAIEIPAERSFCVPGRQRAFVIDARPRRFTVPARTRTFTICKGTCMSSISKYVDEERQYQADWTADLNGQAIVGDIAATSTDPALIVSRVTYAGPIMKFWLEGGTTGRRSTITFVAMTSGGEELVWAPTVICY